MNPEGQEKLSVKTPPSPAGNTKPEPSLLDKLNPTNSEVVKEFLHFFNKGERGKCLQMLQEGNVFIVDVNYAKEHFENKQKIAQNANIVQELEATKTALDIVRRERDKLYEGFRNLYKIGEPFVKQLNKEGNREKELAAVDKYLGQKILGIKLITILKNIPGLKKLNIEEHKSKIARAIGMMHFIAANKEKLDQHTKMYSQPALDAIDLVTENVKEIAAVKDLIIQIIPKEAPKLSEGNQAQNQENGKK